MAEQTSQQSTKTFDVFGRKVDTNKLIQLLSDRDAFDEYYKGKKISESDLENTWRRLNVLRKHLMDGTGGLQVVIDDNGYEGINNTAGMHNLDKKGRVKKGADAYATSYFLRLAKGMDPYEEPKKEPDKSRIKYSDSAIGTAMNRYIYGRDNGDIQDFLDQDKYDKDKKTRANTNRAALFRKGLQHIKDNWDTLFEGWTEDQKTKALQNIDNVFTVFDNDHVITDDEYLALGKATGMNNLRQMFANGEVAVTLSDGTVAPVEPKISRQRTYADKIRWIEKNYKPYTGKLRSPLSIAVPSTEVYGQATADAITNGFKTASNDELYSLIREGLNGADLNNSTLLKKLFPNTNPRISSSYLTKAALEQLRTRTDGLYNFGESNLGMYYIPTTKTKNNTGIVWNANDNTLNEMSIHQIPYWVQRINNEWEALGDDYEENLNSSLTQAYPSHKSGGVIKAQRGTVMDRLGVHSRNNWLNIENTNKNAYNIDTWDNYYNNAGIDENIRHSLLGFNPSLLQERPDPRGEGDPLDITSALRTTYLYRPSEANVTGPWTRGYLKDKDGNIIKGDDGQTKYGLSGAQLGILLNKLEQHGAGLSWDKTLNAKGYDQWNRTFDQTGFNEYFGGDSDRFDFMGPSTYNRHAFLERMKRIYNKDNPLVIGGDKIYWNGRTWALGLEPMKGEIPGLKAEIKVPDKITIPQTSGEEEDASRLVGTDPKDRGKGVNWNKIGQYAADYIPEAINTAMLFDSLRTNQKNWETIDKAIQPKQKVHTFTPRQIVGRYSRWQDELQNAAETESLGYRTANTYSDPSLGAAIRLQANANANKQRTAANIAYDESIRDSQERAWQNVKDFQAIKDEDMFFNHSQRVDAALARAQNTAQKRQFDQKSRANYGKSMLGLYWYRKNLADAKRDEQYKFEKDLELQNSALLSQEAEKMFNNAYDNWLTFTDDSGNRVNKGKSIISFLNTAEGRKAQDWLNQANNMNSARMNSLKSRIYKYDYEDPFGGKYKINYSKNGSKLIPRRRK